jgi:tripartite-type tricarboxylate transporter receptor subunit TctC
LSVALAHPHRHASRKQDVDARHKAGHDGGEASEVVMTLPFRAAVFVVAAGLVPTLANAQAVENFYRGKTINVVIGYPPAGANDFYARAVARHIGKHIPGNPTVIPRNMPGGGSLVAANHIFNVAPKDGTTLGLIVPTAPIEEKLGAANVRFKAAQFNWIGRLAPTPNVTFMNASSPVKTIKDAMEREAVLGATGRSSTVAVYPTMLNHLVGTKFKLVMGYAGSAEAMLAMERGEVEGHSTTWEGVKSRAARQLRDKTINILVQYGLQRHPELPDIPTAVELGRNNDEVLALRFFANASDVGRFILSTPDTPADRIQALRRAFDDMVKDPEFIADLEAQKLDLGPLGGEELQKLIEEVANVPPAILEKVRGLYPLN